jgi:hypothetical protein
MTGGRCGPRWPGSRAARAGGVSIGAGSVTVGDDGLGDVRYLVRLSVPRAGGWRAWGTVRDEFGRQLAGRESAAAALHVASEIRRGRDYGRVVILATVDADDVADAGVHSFLATSGPVMRASSGKVAAMMPRAARIPPAVMR